jgi:DNA-binding NarL/FixJ family response regulator
MAWGWALLAPGESKMSALRQSGSPPKTRILVVDDHPMIRERLAEVIAREPDLVVCGEAEDARSALGLAETANPDLAIVDLTLKTSHGLDLIKDLQVRCPQVAILVVSMHEEAILAERVIRAGARGYITKQEATKSVLTAIRAVLDGRVYLSQAMALRLASKVARRAQPEAKSAIDVLTDRELRVFQLIGEGRGTREIAQQMGLHVTTVETYRARIKEKLHLRDANDLRRQAISWMTGGRLRQED